MLPLEKSEKEEIIFEDLEKEELTADSGLCGIWEDERSPEEIIDDIYSHRSGFGNRQVLL